ncbi:Nif3-like dinuclear metal center hexameric protein [Campylobacter ureolyticus]|uniref:Nif3-like dinuclear metal center hexameric protein n=1 Tax=Campylobacter ureolyticus TaxID=827 RepID=UPI001FC7CA54|nr:Nif3-like dinuclear metal center hexameric protein [Campylobacter ureolyticus]MCZ6104831.1 Nif3-like dinuclear metal center hexameric protein [Campylobacter ureolyticus]MCZ6132899.1 Nif3-like dinuclear metal center hexameric protein [Campylobacter ureolyticus]MCZ6157447.1 Nif3-like dinuclear metal center hexameric protein [Campylobacter ureolyticus]MCZ6173365.1 Nif3-like dinuclear metal center hexameric protein [Campylobacter ureolyticus]GKH60066.1 GTP cyclohydrolase 1 type 2 [Campylobacter
MKIAEIYQILDEVAPFEAQESWDNSGLLLGKMDDEFDKIYASIDLDSNLIQKIEKNSLIITHHPLIFKGLKSLNPSIYPSNLIYEIIKKDIKLISMHTNFDKFVLNKFVASEILGYEITEIRDFLAFFEVNKSFDEFAKEIKQKLKISNLRAVKAGEFIKTATLCTGSGADLLGSFKSDCFLTGDIKYHSALESLENKISLIDINHFESEAYFGQSLAKNLQKYNLNIIITNSINPFLYI